MSLPPKATLLLENIQGLGDNAVLGIDTKFFTVKNFLRGVKLIPKGLHFLHYSETLDEGSAVRYGWWFECGDKQVVTWDIKAEKGISAPDETDLKSLGHFYPYMIEYPENARNWAELTRFLDLEAVEEYVAIPSKPISTATPLLEENMVLLDVLRKKSPNHTFLDTHLDELKYTIIQANKRRPASSGTQVTGDVLDKSWHLESLFAHDPEILLAELQLSFLHFLILGNVCSLTQWMSLLLLLLLSRSFLAKNRAFAEEFLRVFETQLVCLPEEYMVLALAVQIVDMAKFTETLTNFQDVCGESPAWRRICEVNAARFNITIKAPVFDAENFEVYDLDAHDSADEDAPALV